MPVCVDPSHSVGTHDVAPDGLPDVFHVAAQGIISGANLVLTDIHPEPKKALVDAAQALTLEELPRFLEDCAIVREAYLKRLAK
jgi:3-deoxy-7-phosphoheptulonate synthase